MKKFVVGDLHGCYDALMEKLNEIGFDKKVDHLYSVGDLIDRGTHSVECLRLVNESWFTSVLGNHEDMMINAIERGYESREYDLWMYNGGKWFDEIKHDKKLVYELNSLAKSLPLHITVDEKYGICHAQPPTPNWDDVRNGNLDHLRKKAMIWGRNWIEMEYRTGVANIYKTYHGHTPISEPVRLGNVNFIDTGVVFATGELTIVELV